MIANANRSIFRLFIVFCIALLCSGFALHAQTNSGDTVIKIGNDATVTLSRKHVFQPNPKRAGLYSAILPGLGQFYNRQYWKIPVIYGGLAVAGYYFADNLTNYQNYRKAYIGRINNPYPTDKYVGIYTVDQLQQLQNDYNRFLNLTVLFTGVGYTLQVLEAITGAHLKNFDVSRDISLHAQPAVFPKAIGISVAVNFR